MYTNIPDWMLIADINMLKKMIDTNLIPPKPLDFDKLELGFSELNNELESRIPYVEPEYDCTGNIITSEVMGYDDKGNEIWN